MKIQDYFLILIISLIGITVVYRFYKTILQLNIISIFNKKIKHSNNQVLEENKIDDSTSLKPINREKTSNYPMYPSSPYLEVRPGFKLVREFRSEREIWSYEPDYNYISYTNSSFLVTFLLILFITMIIVILSI